MRNSLENKEIRASLIKNYELLEEKLNQNDIAINKLKKIINSEGYQEEKGEKTKIFSEEDQIFEFSIK